MRKERKWKIRDKKDRDSVVVSVCLSVCLEVTQHQLLPPSVQPLLLLLLKLPAQKQQITVLQTTAEKFPGCVSSRLLQTIIFPTAQMKRPRMICAFVLHTLTASADVFFSHFHSNVIQTQSGSHLLLVGKTAACLVEHSADLLEGIEERHTWKSPLPLRVSRFDDKYGLLLWKGFFSLRMSDDGGGTKQVN